MGAAFKYDTIKENLSGENVNEDEVLLCINFSHFVDFSSGDRQKGWQFGENLRTQSSGWFPLAYTEIIIDDSLG